MIAISILVKGGAVFTGIFLAIAGPKILPGRGYGIWAAMVSIGTSNFPGNRVVSLEEV